MKAKKLSIFIISLLLGVNSVNSSFAYWNHLHSYSTNIAAGIAIGDFDFPISNLQDGNFYPLNKGDYFKYKDKIYVSLIDTVFAPEYIDWDSPWKGFNLIDPLYSPSNYYDEFSAPVVYDDQRYIATHSGASNANPTSASDWAKYSAEKEYFSENAYLKNSVVVFEGTYFLALRNTIPSTSPGTESAWKKIQSFSSKALWNKGELCYRDSIIYQSLADSNPILSTNGKWNIYNPIKFIYERPILTYENTNTYFKGDYIFGGYDKTMRMRIFHVETEEVVGVKPSSTDARFSLIDNSLD